jgi:hypothetical protein
MLEDLIKVLWATLAESHAEKLSTSGLDQLKLMMRANLQGGTARIVDKHGNDHSERFMKEGKLAPSGKKKTVEAMAREAGAEGLYNMFYRFASMQTHGSSLDSPVPIAPADVSAVLSGVGAIAKSYRAYFNPLAAWSGKAPQQGASRSLGCSLAASRLGLIQALAYEIPHEAEAGMAVKICAASTASTRRPTTCGAAGSAA